MLTPILVSLLLAGPALAGRFVNITETATFPKGEGEVVQATSFSICTDGSCPVEVLELQIGAEYGLFNRFQLGFALPNVATVWGEDRKTTEIDGTSFWGLYNLIDPEAAGWGLALAAIYGQGDEFQTGELALLAEKPLGDWILVYNGIVGRSWARIEKLGHADAQSHSLGASYQLTGSIYLGVETDWFLENDPERGWESLGRYLGPNISVETGPLWVTAGAHFAFGPGDIIPEQVFQAQIGLPF